MNSPQSRAIPIGRSSNSHLRVIHTEGIGTICSNSGVQFEDDRSLSSNNYDSDGSADFVDASDTTPLLPPVLNPPSIFMSHLPLLRLLHHHQLLLGPTIQPSSPATPTTGGNLLTPMPMTEETPCAPAGISQSTNEPSDPTPRPATATCHQR